MKIIIVINIITQWHNINRPSDIESRKCYIFHTEV